VAENATSPVRVLVADDEAANRMVMKIALRKAQAEAIIVENGQEAIDAVAGHEFDLVLLDLTMPVKSGWDACEWICENLPLEKRPILVAWTALLKNQVEEDCRHSGFQKIINKPTSPRVIAKLIEELPTLRAERNGGS